MVTWRRGSVARSATQRRMPAVVLWRNSAAVTASASSSGAITSTRKPERPFFICTGHVCTSSAPALTSACRSGSTYSGLMSSTSVASHPAVSHGDRQVVDGLHTELLEPFDRADDVEYGVHSTDFVQVDLLRRDAVHAALGGTDQTEGAHRPLLHPIRHGGTLDQAHQLSDVPTMRLLGDHEFDLAAPHPAPVHLADGDLHTRQGEATQQLLEPRRRDAHRQERPEGHVT